MSNSLTDELLNTLLSLSLDGDRDDTLKLLLFHSCAMYPPIRSFSDIKYTDFTGDILEVNVPADLTRHMGLGSAEFTENPRFAVLECGVFAANYGYVRGMLGQGMVLSVAHLDIYHSILTEICRCAKDGTAASVEPIVLPLLHSLEESLRRFPLPSSDLIDRLSSELDLLRRWPLPYSSSAHRVLSLLFQENKCIGSSVIHTLRESFRFIDVCLPLERQWEADKPAISSSFLFYSGKDGPETGLFLSLESLSQRLFFERLKTAAKEARQELDVDLVALLAHAYRIQVVLFMHARHNTLNAQDLSHISGFGLKDVFRIYQRVLKMRELIDQIDAEAGRDLLGENMTDLLNEMEQISSDSSDPLTQVLLMYLRWNENYTPNIPPEFITVIDGSTEGEFEGGLERIMTRAKDPESVYFNSPVKLAFAGSDPTFHSFLTAYFRLITRIPALYTDTELWVYVIPVWGARNSLAQYVATVDSWYQRYVYVPFARKPFLPRVDLHPDAKKPSKRTFIDLDDTSRSSIIMDDPYGLEDAAPTQAMHSLLQDYLREARCCLALRVFEVKCWRNTERGGSPDLVLPLGLYLEIGISAAVMRAKQSFEEFSNKSTAEVQESKHFRYTAPTVCLRVLEVDLLGRTFLHEEETVKEIRSLTLSNVPRDSDCSPDALPSSEWLELSLLEERAALEAALLRKKKQKNSKLTLAQHVLGVNSLYTNLHVLDVAVSVQNAMSPDKAGVDIIIDGEIYGPFGGLEIGPWEMEGRQWPELKVMTFLEPDI